MLTVNNHDIFVDISKNEILYPSDIKIGRKTTTNLNHEENLVVLKCIVDLIEQGYKPINIEIEKGYRLGRNKKSGNADITVKDNNDKTFMIIECKISSLEFDKAWRDTQKDGGQLFSYERQENVASVLVLYTVSFLPKELKVIYKAISLIDNENYLSSIKSNKSYKNAKGGNQKFNTWKEVYKYDYIENGVLESDIQPYKISKPKRDIHSLEEINELEVNKKYNKFASILRQYNVGAKENAFDVLVNLFLAKIVDEELNQNDLQFNWKGTATDTYFDLVDRLEKLYQNGMEKFLNETVTYVGEEEVKKAFRLHPQPDAAEEAILNYFKQVKYFTNNNFSLIEVYNEDLFVQNSKILTDIVKLFEDLKLKTNRHNQFLGDLFEGFLDNGVKQSEGQFFTPLPIVKFLISSLPLEKINEKDKIPKVIDYACGAGHFLNQYAEEIKKIKKVNNLYPDYLKNIYGIEKEYRLSKVAKVSSFMYGQDEIQILYKDALKLEPKIEEESYSLVISNPPYSVKGFLSTLPQESIDSYKNSEIIKDYNSASHIEIFFVEKAIKLLESGGMTALILPASLLNNTYEYNILTRKLLLENFEIISIVSFGSRTFGSTGTNTITLFMRKREYPPSEPDFYRYSIRRWFNDTATDEDVLLMMNYTEKISIDYEDYAEIRTGNLDKVLSNEIFKDYEEKFRKTPQGKKNYIKNYKLYKEQLIEYIQSIEEEKAYYFTLANEQNNKIVVVEAPTKKTKEEQQFLGYKWVGQRGNEGIQYLGIDEDIDTEKNRALSSIDTPLFNPQRDDDPDKISTII